MTFPSTSILDDFQRPDEGPPPSASWITGPYTEANGYGMSVSSNQVKGVNSSYGGTASWNTTCGPDCEVFAKIGVVSSSFILYWRLSDPTNPSLQYGYRFYGWNSGGSHLLGIDSLNGTVDSTVILWTSTTSGNIANGDEFGVSHVGDTITVYQNRSGAGWELVHTLVDNTYNSAGYIGMGLANTTARLDDFGGGTIVSGFTGDLSQTLGALSLSADGWLERIGDLAQTLGALTLAAQGEALTYQYPILINVQRITASGAGAIGVKVVDHAISQNVRADSLVVEDGGILEVRSVYYDTITTLGAGQIVPLRGDRAVWDVDNYATRHASDINGSTWVYHTNPARAGTYAVVNPTTDRAFDVNSTSLFEIASVLGTLLGDLGMT